MFILKTKSQLDKAIAKARKVRCEVKFKSFGTYKVSGSNGAFYTVKMERTATGEKQVSCECKGAERGLVCYHSAAALSLHVGLARQQATA